MHSKGGSLNLDDHVPGSEQLTVREVLLAKHPKGEPMRPSAVIDLEAPVQAPHPVIFEQIDSLLI